MNSVRYYRKHNKKVHKKINLTDYKIAVLNNLFTLTKKSLG